MKRNVLNLLIALFFLTLQMPTTIAASFDCTKAGTQVERLICSTPILSELDVALAQNYRNMRASNIGDGASTHIVQTQREWMRQRNTCSSADCIERIYRKRLDEICSYPVLTGMHPPCKYSDDIGRQSTANVENRQPSESSASRATPQPRASAPQTSNSGNKEFTTAEKAGICAGYHSGYAIMSNSFGHRNDRDHSVNVVSQLDTRYGSSSSYKPMKDFAFKTLTEALQNKNASVFAGMIAMCQQIGAPAAINTGR